MDLRKSEEEEDGMRECSFAGANFGGVGSSDIGFGFRKNWECRRGILEKKYKRMSDRHKNLSDRDTNSELDTEKTLLK